MSLDQKALALAQAVGLDIKALIGRTKSDPVTGLIISVAGRLV